MAVSVKAEAVNCQTADLESLKKVTLLIVGSPTQGGRATEKLMAFFENIPEDGLSGVKVATFDTRLDYDKQNFALKLLLRTIGYAAPKMMEILVSKGATEVTSPEGFMVGGKSGPLADGELERAEKWAKQVAG